VTESGGFVRLGLHVPDFTWEGGPAELAPRLTAVARLAEDTGFDRLSVMDHLWQIPGVGPEDHDMLEAYTALGFLAAQTSRISLLTLVTAVTYRDPGLLAKAVTTLDVLSGGRAWLGIGAAWNADESAGLGLFFPPTAERFERLEEALQIFLQMCGEEDAPYEGRHYTLGRTLNVPAPLSRPRPRILIGGGGEKKTLLLVARYADACNLFAGPGLEHKLDVLRAHCEAEGRDYDSLEKTVMYRFDVGPNGERVPEILTDLERLAGVGVDVVHGSLREVGSLRPLEILGTEVLPEVAPWGRA
jgi:alkanesulfonate monooxygenase